MNENITRRKTNFVHFNGILLKLLLSFIFSHFFVLSRLFYSKLGSPKTDKWFKNSKNA